MYDATRPHADPSDIGLMAPRRWYFETKFPMRYVLVPGFFDHAGMGFRVADRIDVIAFGDTPASHAILVVDEIITGGLDRVRVSPMVEYERKAP